MQWVKSNVGIAKKAKKNVVFRRERRDEYLNRWTEKKMYDQYVCKMSESFDIEKIRNGHEEQWSEKWDGDTNFHDRRNRKIWFKVFKNRPNKICERQSLKNLKWYGLPNQNNFLKAFFHKFYLVHSWIPWPIYAVK